MDKLKVLVFVDWYKPGYRGGGPVRSMINMVDHLGDQCHFHIVTTDTDYTRTEPYTGIVPDQWTDLSTGERVWYASKKKTNSKVWQTLLNGEKWDAIYVNGMFSLWYSILPLWFTKGSKQRRIVVARGMLLPGPVKQGAFKKQVFLFVARSLGIYNGVEFQATSDDETESIGKQIGRSTTIHLVSNLPREVPDNGIPKRTKVAGEAYLVNVVRIATEKNVHLIIETLRGVHGRVIFNLYGPVYHAEYWAQCEQAIKTLPANITFNYNGPVASEEVLGILSGQHHALFMPNEGDNYGHTMVEAMTTGLPLLLADTSPWRDLQAKHAGWDIPLDRPALFTQALQTLVDMDQAGFDHLCKGAYAMGMTQVQDPKTKDGMLKMLRG
ncbi:MAG: glycosyltransferase family 4 protein [Flavobacteriales bacterium]|nr:glycosyltransferase family 4 protein [Flavobacteriales bacterium]